MKCFSGCGYSESPENLRMLTRHVESCSVAHPASEKKVVWRNSEFVVVDQVSEDDTVIEHSFQTFEAAPTVPAIVVPSQSGRPSVDEEVVVVIPEVAEGAEEPA